MMGSATPLESALVRKVRRLWVIALLLGIVGTEGTARVGLKWIHAKGLIVEAPHTRSLSPAHREIIRTRILGNQTEYTDYSPQLGWTIKPNGRSALYHSNSQGIRADGDYSTRPPSSVLRIATFGDSFTHGDDVGGEDTWQSQLEGMDPQIEVLNFGVGGYGTDQALLRYQHEGIGFHPRVVFLGFFPENIYRVVSVFRPFYVPETLLPMSKPSFRLGDRGLELFPNPIPSRAEYGTLLTDTERELARLGRRDYHFNRAYRQQSGWVAALDVAAMSLHYVRRAMNASDAIEIGGRFNPASEAYKILVGVFLRFRDVAEASGSRPIVLILPGPRDIADHRRGRPRRYAPLLPELERQGIDHVDLMDALDSHANDAMFVAVDRHYTPIENGIVARSLHDYLIGQRIIEPLASAGPTVGLRAPGGPRS